MGCTPSVDTAEQGLAGDGNEIQILGPALAKGAPKILLVRLVYSSSNSAQFGGLRVRCEQRRETLGIAARHATFGRYTVDPDMAPGGGEASGVSGHVVAVNEAEIEFGFRAQFQPGERCEIGVVGTRFRHRQVEKVD